MISAMSGSIHLTIHIDVYADSNTISYTDSYNQIRKLIEKRSSVLDRIEVLEDAGFKIGLDYATDSRIIPRN